MPGGVVSVALIERISALPAATERLEKRDLRFGDLRIGKGKVRFRTGQRPLGVEHHEEIDPPFAQLRPADVRRDPRLFGRLAQGALPAPK